MRALMIMLIIILQIVLGWLFYRDQTTCCGLEAEGAQEAAPALVRKPILFSWRSAIPDTIDSWTGFKDSLLSEIDDDKKLEVTIKLSREEAAGDLRDSLARQRGWNIRKLFPELSDEQIFFKSDTMVYDSSHRKNLFDAISFSVRTNTKNIVESASETVIYFPYNSTQELNADDVKAYLDEIATSVAGTGEIISLTGHTDNVGEEEYNLNLSRKRAEVIQQYLIYKGVSASQILVEGKGELEPIGDNNTEAGRQQNRRTVLQIRKP